MSLAIAGMGWVTPLGNDVADVWRQLHEGVVASAESISSPEGKTFSVYKVPAAATAQLPPHPRLRRSSAISRFAAAAGLAALKDAGVDLTPDVAARMGLVFAVSNGGVIYTRRFYDEIVDKDARAASPLLFPETVFNAPASHLAAILGLTGATYTLVGDGATGILAVKMAEDLIRNHNLDYCLVVGTEETDWLLCDAYRKWRLLRRTPPIELFRVSPKGTILSEGAGAVLLGRSGAIQIGSIDAGTNFEKQTEAGDAMEAIFCRLCQDRFDLIVGSANGTFVDAAEHAAILRHGPTARTLFPKVALGESVGASGLWQIICGGQALLTQSAPDKWVGSSETEIAPASGPIEIRRVMISVCGLNQQATGLTLVSN